jgi:hypothetical protein
MGKMVTVPKRNYLYVNSLRTTLPSFAGLGVKR